jgi:immune inhibitor A
MEEKNNHTQVVFLGILMVGLALICLAGILLGFQYSTKAGEKTSQLDAADEEDNTVTATAMDQTDSAVSPSQAASETAQEQTIGQDTLEMLERVDVPENDPLELARRFNGVPDPRVQLKELPSTKKNGTKEDFWVLDVDENSYRQISAALVYQTAHLYFWVEEGVDYDPDAVVQLANTFENQIYPVDRENFGSEWTPGVDNDSHLVIVYARQLGSAAGYFSGTDSLMPEVKSYSNMAEMFYLSADFTDLSSSFTSGVLAHEFQHMIHWNQDRNEDSWLNEGLSELAVDLNGFEIGGFDYFFAFDPDLQLNYWPGNDQGDTSPHYGASYLFTKYLLAQFGSQAITELVQNPKNGLASVDEVLSEEWADYIDSGNGDVFAGDQIFQNWTIANYLQDSQIQNGIYGYGDKTNLPVFSPTEELTCDSDWKERTVNQYGTDYIQVNCDGDFTIEIKGADQAALLPVKPNSGDYYFWSNSGDESHMKLSRDFDFSQVSGPIEMQFWTWYDIEKDYDYVFITASVDGANWEILQSTTCTTANPTGANYGCGFNGKTEGWIKEMVDLSRFSGKQVKLQFEYLTDAAVNGEGFLIDDISIDAIGYTTDFENDAGEWTPSGFVRIRYQIPQAFSVALIQNGDETQVQKWISGSGLDQIIQVNKTDSQQETTLAISGLTRYTHIPASYSIKVTKVN